MRGLPQPLGNFLEKKGKILEQLSIPEAAYIDASPKGSVDAGIRDLIDEINSLDGFVTTSSCAGRVSVFVEGRKAGADLTEDTGDSRSRETEGDDAGRTVAGVGGKGGGGAWLFVSHDPVKADAGSRERLREIFGLQSQQALGQETIATGTPPRLIHFKFEPMILHVLTASLDHAQLLLKCGLQAGFRESGAINLMASAPDTASPIVAIRSMGLALESLVGVQKGDDIQCTVSLDYLQTLLDISNERFAENTKRIQRFRAALYEANQPRKPKMDGTAWEDASARRARKKAEGMLRKAEQQASRQEKDFSEPPDSLDLALNADFT